MSNLRAHFSDRRDDLYSRYRLARTDEERRKVIKDMQRFNMDARKYRGVISPITTTSLRWKLRIDYVDREIIAKVALRLDRQEEDVTEKEMPPCSLLGRIAKALKHGYSPEIGVEGAHIHVWQIPLDDTRYLGTLESVIQELARSQSLVIHGRGSQFILKNCPQAFHVLVTAPIGVRLKRVMDSSSLDQDTAKREIAQSDNGVREFIKRYFKAEVWDGVHYDLVLNTEYFDFGTAESIITNAFFLKEKILSGKNRAA